MKTTHKAFLLVTAILLGVFVVSSVYINDGKFIRMYLSSEISQNERATMETDYIEVNLRVLRDDMYEYLEGFIMIPYIMTSSTDYGLFWGVSDGRHFDISRLAIELEWEIYVNESYSIDYHILSVPMNVTEGSIILEMVNSTWTLGWDWLSYFRMQDETLYGIQFFGYLLSFVLIGNFILWEILDKLEAKWKERNLRELGE